MKKNMCVSNEVGGKHNCDCNGIAKKCSEGESKAGSKYCRFVMFVGHTTGGGFPVCKNPDARKKERKKELLVDK